MIPFMPLSVSVEGLSLVFYICICLPEYIHQETNVTLHMHLSFNQSDRLSGQLEMDVIRITSDSNIDAGKV